MKKITIYLDVVFLENIFMNYIILFSVTYILKEKKNYFRLIISATIGAIYLILSYISALEIYSNFIFKIILSFIMVYVAYKPKTLKKFVKQIVFFYLTSFIFGGCVFSLLYFINSQEILEGLNLIKIVILGGIAGSMVLIIAFRFVKVRISKKDIICDIFINFETKMVKVKAMIDTGNMLKDPISKMPVVVVQKDMLYDLISREIIDSLENVLGGDTNSKIYYSINNNIISKFRIIPFSSIGKENGLLLGFKADSIEIFLDNDYIKKENIIIGIYNGKISNNKKYYALLGLELIEGSDKNEYIGIA